MKDLEKVRVAGAVMDLLESMNCRREDILEISDLIKEQLEVKERYQTVPASAVDPVKPCTN
ncbi:MAG TPA: hypothetical protein PK869_02185 [Candidatus Hydrogenedentes bacterium]|nr:hypothetical protein [Candidatus Hydrogenedentota bacterium]